jgi:hypothetical protein
VLRLLGAFHHRAQEAHADVRPFAQELAAEEDHRRDVAGGDARLVLSFRGRA